jgi:hypothetical protein
MTPADLSVARQGKVSIPRWMILVGVLAGQILFTLAMAEAPVLGLAQAAALLAFGMYGVLKRDLTIIICVIAYTTGCEVLWRQIRVPMFWMGASYLVTLLSAFAVLFVLQRLGKSARIALLYLALLLPAMIATIRTTGENAREIIAFALAGPAALAAFAAFTSQVNVQPWLYRRILWITVISAVGPLTFAIQTLLGDLAGGGLSFDNQSNFSASGGFGPVQVSSLLSLGVMAALLLIILETSLVVRVLAGLITVVMAVQTLLTFSRGGSFSVGIAMTALGIYQAKNRRVRNTIIAVAVVAFTLAALVVFPWIDSFTQGAFEERFSDTQTGRTELASNDTEIFADNIVLGVGAGMTKYQRLTYEICELRSDKCIDEVSSHTEFTRMLSEHGIPGVIGLVLFAMLTWQALRRPGPGQGFAIAWVAWALSQMVYANLRVVAVPFAFGVAFLRFSELRPSPGEHVDHDAEWQPLSPERFVGPSGTHAVALSASTQHPQLSSGLPIWDPATGRLIGPGAPASGSTEGPLSPDAVLPPRRGDAGPPPTP